LLDGSAFAVADVAGQFSLYGAGPAEPLLLAAPYDQFFKKDYDPIMQVNALQLGVVLGTPGLWLCFAMVCCLWRVG
jgi:hypothetical protein